MAESRKKQTKPKQSNRKYIIGFWTLFGVGVLAVIFFFLLAGWGVFGKMPTFEELENTNSRQCLEFQNYIKYILYNL